MSLVRIAARIAAVQALRGRTDVNQNVLDSRLGALDVTSDGAMRTDQDKPFVSVYTDAAKAGGEDGPAGSELDIRTLRMNGATEIIFEAGITAAMVETNLDTDESTIVGIGTPSTDEGFEFQLDMIARQIGDALSDPENEWAEVFRGLVRRFVSIERSRAGTAEGQRMAAHQIKIMAELIPDPVRGEVLKPTSSMARFFALADQVEEPDFVTQIAAMQSAIGGGVRDWQTDLRRYGLTRAEGDAMLITTPEGAEGDAQDIAVVDVNSAPAVPVQP